MRDLSACGRSPNQYKGHTERWGRCARTKRVTSYQYVCVFRVSSKSGSALGKPRRATTVKDERRAGLQVHDTLGSEVTDWDRAAELAEGTRDRTGLAHGEGAVPADRWSGDHRLCVVDVHTAGVHVRSCSDPSRANEIEASTAQTTGHERVLSVLLGATIGVRITASRVNTRETTGTG